MKPDEAHQLTDQEFAALEKRIAERLEGNENDRF